jgi:hypothetical protein
MVCAVNTLEGAVVLVSHHPISVFRTTAEHLSGIPKKPDGHYDREHMMTLVKQGHAVLFDEEAVRTIGQALVGLIHGCPPH